MDAAYSDIFIIGGGINGTGIAADAAGRGLSVTLCEKLDLAAGTSSASSKLIHGGLRYLENYQFHLVKSALQEREILLHNAPHLISPLKFILPYAKHLRPAWMIRLGLFLYDHLASHPLLPNSKKIVFKQNENDEALLSSFQFGFSYYDCATDDARLVIANAIAAVEHGATIQTRTECISANYVNNQWKIQLKKSPSNEQFVCYAKVLVNAAGPWIETVQKNQIHVQNNVNVKLVKGSHIVVPRLYTGNFAYILQNPDKRVVFAIPYQQEFTLIGTTDVIFKMDTDAIKITPDETNYLCETINHYFKKTLKPQDVIWSYAGVRCLQDDTENSPSRLSRDYKLQLVKSPPLLTVMSGKITTYRRLAEDAVNQLQPFFPNMQSAWTATKPLPGGDMQDSDFSLFYQTFCQTYAWLPESIAHRYAKSYGTRAHLILMKATSLSDLGVEFAAGLYQKEVEYLIQHEWAITTDDILWRRTKLGLFFSPIEVTTLANWLQNNLPSNHS